MKFNALVPESPYIFRYLAYALLSQAKQSVYDYKYFSNVRFKGGGAASLEKKIESIGDVEFNVKGVKHTLNALVSGTDTLSFLVVKDGKIIFQHYSDGIREETPLLSYSVTKSFFSSYLSRLQQFGVFSFSDMLDQHNQNMPSFIGKRTIQSLMNMESGIRYIHGKSPSTDMVRFWFSPNVRNDLLSIKQDVSGQSHFLYNDIHLHLLYRMLDNKLFDVASDFYHSIWKSFDMTYDGLLMQDSSKRKWLKMDGGLSLTAYDMAKFGQIYLDDGMVNENQILPLEWCRGIKKSVNTRMDLDYWDLYRQNGHRWYPVFKEGRTYYKNFWWGINQNEGPNDIYAMGILGQFVYVSSKNGVVIVRQGNSWGIDGWWPSIFEKLAEKVNQII